VKRSTAVRHLVEMTADCEALNERLDVVDSTMRVTQLWAYGDILDPRATWGDDRTFTRAAVVVTVPESETAWLAPPAGLEWAGSMVRWDKRPVHVVWRSADAPVWNHLVRRPLLLWEAGTGPSALAIEALRDGADLAPLRLPEPSEDELRERLEREAAVSLAAVRRAADEFERKRWRRADHLQLADSLWAVTQGYLDVLDALSELGLPTAE
jgi:hypothetical protein